eukprot:2098967-Pyramimonas_sp.AAC.1
MLQPAECAARHESAGRPVDYKKTSALRPRIYGPRHYALASRSAAPRLRTSSNAAQRNAPGMAAAMMVAMRHMCGA